MVLYNICYDGRPLFYRLALSDMNIPYADPRHPYYKKSAFDLGDARAGYTANNLKLGYDCLGSIHYVSATLSSPRGDAIAMENCVYIHEQHIFCLRADHIMDGPMNTVTYDEVEPLEWSKVLNPHGTGYISQETIVKKSGGYNLDMTKNRVYKIKNLSSINPVNKKAVAYKIMAPDFQKIVAQQESFNYRRTEFSSHNLFVTKYQPNELTGSNMGS
ncbi:copper amine oxidase [Truncatella angustata]|uniref:Amine oxidase n=1 Tax=Truncatella angustata TaxID=152316 RepID=A0A9P8UUA9_9PEZI|nr:copper amine oxidase [Truncatella angustata]KAH6658499.1 copper amine oxidase [Truncatella angustata]